MNRVSPQQIETVFFKSLISKPLVITHLKVNLERVTAVTTVGIMNYSMCIFCIN